MPTPTEPHISRHKQTNGQENNLESTPYRAHGGLPLEGGDIHSAMPIGGAIAHAAVAVGSDH